MRGRETVADMVRSMAVLMIPILFLLAWLAWTNEKPSPTVEPVPWQPVASKAVDEMPYHVVAPSTIPHGWIPNRVTLSTPQRPQEGAPPGNYWMLGFMTDNNIFVQLNQSDAPANQFIAQMTRDGVSEDVVSIRGTQWRRYQSVDERTRSLVSRQDKVTTIVVGDTDYEVLEKFAETLAPYQG